jgi:heat shock protein HtpX
VTLGLRLRCSLVVRTVVALGVLGTLTFLLAIITSLLGAFLGVALFGLLVRGYEFVLTMPRLSAVSPVPAVAAAPLSLLVVVAIVYGWEHVSAYTDSETLLPPTDVPTGVLSVVGLVSLYLLLVEGIVALGVVVSAALSDLSVIVVALGFGIVLAIAATVGEVRREIGRLRESLLEDSVAAADQYPETERIVHRLAQQADVPAPEVRVLDRGRPESFTVGTGSDAVVVVSSGLIETLDDAELEAVLAHEVSHLANRDSRIMGAALAPVLAADDWIEENTSDPRDVFWNALFGALKWYGQAGLAVFSRGRELGADAGAAALTGSPAALASALRRLDEERRAPETDLREWERSAAALDILPPSVGEATGPFDTHPSTEARIERLRRLAAAAEGD